MNTPPDNNRTPPRLRPRTSLPSRPDHTQTSLDNRRQPAQWLVLTTQDTKPAAKDTSSPSTRPSTPPPGVQTGSSATSPAASDDASLHSSISSAFSSSWCDPISGWAEHHAGGSPAAEDGQASCASMRTDGSSCGSDGLPAWAGYGKTLPGFSDGPGMMVPEWPSFGGVSAFPMMSPLSCPEGEHDDRASLRPAPPTPGSPSPWSWTGYVPAGSWPRGGASEQALCGAQGYTGKDDGVDYEPSESSGLSLKKVKKGKLKSRLSGAFRGVGKGPAVVRRVLGALRQ